MRADDEESLPVGRDAERERALHERALLARHDVQTVQGVSGVENRVRLAAALQEQLSVRAPRRKSNIPARDRPEHPPGPAAARRDDPDLDPAPLGGARHGADEGDRAAVGRDERRGGVASDVLPGVSVSSHVRDQIGRPDPALVHQRASVGEPGEAGAGRAREHACGSADRRDHEVEPLAVGGGTPVREFLVAGRPDPGKESVRARDAATAGVDVDERIARTPVDDVSVRQRPPRGECRVEGEVLSGGVPAAEPRDPPRSLLGCVEAGAGALRRQALEDGEDHTGAGDGRIAPCARGRRADQGDGADRHDREP